MSRSGQNEDLWLHIATVKPMMLAIPTFVPISRTTLCDINCTTNTPFPLMDLPPPPEKLKQLSATLPYDKPLAGLVGPLKASTKFQRMKVDDVRLRKIAELKRDREEFFRRLNIEKIETTNRRNRAATKIQAAFRGYRVRPKPYYEPMRKPKVYLTQMELLDELCKMATDLQLNPIPGLNLESRTKASKRKIRIDNAAAFRIQKFLKMIFQRSMARVVVSKKKSEKFNKAAKIITKAVRYTITRKFVKRVDLMKRVQLATKIQARVRQYQAKGRYVFFFISLILDYMC